MKSKDAYNRIRQWLDGKEKEGFHLNGCCLIICDYKAKTFDAFVEVQKDAMARSLAAVFLDDDIMWKAYKYANRLALQEKREKEKENGSK